jgi:hypothetical protein
VYVEVESEGQMASNDGCASSEDHRSEVRVVSQSRQRCSKGTVEIGVGEPTRLVITLHSTFTQLAFFRRASPGLFASCSYFTTSLHYIRLAHSIPVVAAGHPNSTTHPTRHLLYFPFPQFPHLTFCVDSKYSINSLLGC